MIPLTPIAATPGSAAGYYAQRQLILLTAGAEQFAADFSLNPNDPVGVADEALVQLSMDNADNMVDGEAYKLTGFVFSGAAGHAVAQDDEPLYTALCRWASRWARADGHLMRGEPTSPQNDDGDLPATTPPGGGAEGLFTSMKREAERNVKALLTAKVKATIPQQGHLNKGQPGMLVGKICRPIGGTTVDVWG